MKKRYALKTKSFLAACRLCLMMLALTGTVMLASAQDYQREAVKSKSPVNAQIIYSAAQTNPATSGVWTKSSGPGKVTLAEPASTGYFLGDNRPNPFISSTEVSYVLPETGKVRLSLVNIIGSEIAVVVDNVTQSAGAYTVRFSSVGLNPGVYFYKLVVNGETTDFVDTKRMVISR